MNSQVTRTRIDGWDEGQGHWAGPSGFQVVEDNALQKGLLSKVYSLTKGIAWRVPRKLAFF
jgi:hypothetical protein